MCVFFLVRLDGVHCKSAKGSRRSNRSGFWSTSVDIARLFLLNIGAAKRYHKAWACFFSLDEGNVTEVAEVAGVGSI